MSRSYLFLLLKVMACSCLFLLTTNSLFAQEKPDFKQAQNFTPKQMHEMTGSNMVRAHWIEDQNRFWYSYKAPEGKNWYFVNADEQLKRNLFDRKKISAQLSEIFNKPFNFKDLDLKDFKYNAKEERFTFYVDSINFNYNLQTNDLVKKDLAHENSSNNNWKTYSPDSTWIVFAKNYDLHLIRADDPDSTEYQLTDNGLRWYNYQADEGDTTHNERLKAGAHWINNSKLYVNRQDVRKVKSLWVIHSLQQPRPSLETYKYPMPGERSLPIDEVWLFKADTLSSTNGLNLELKTGIMQDLSSNSTSYYKIMGNSHSALGVPLDVITGTRGKYMWLLRRNREFTKINVIKVNTVTGDSKILFTEKVKPYFTHRFIRTRLSVINDGQEYIWWSERSGWGQLYRYGSDGNLKNRITQGEYTVGNIAKIDTTDQTIYFNAYGREEGVNPYYSQLYKIKFDGSGMKRLTSEDANHKVSVSGKGDYFVDNYSRVNKPTKSVLRSANGHIVQQLEETDVSAMKKVGWRPPSLFKIKAADGTTDLYGVMWKPFNFDSTKTYPIIANVYPGPQIKASFPTSFRLTQSTALAQLGFIVVSFGQRGGSLIRSKKYHTFGYGNLRDYPLADNKYGIEELAAKHNYIDLNRVGIWGHSGGGFMSTAAILTYPNFYKVAWSESGNHDNNIYKTTWAESHNGVKKVTKTIKVDNDQGRQNDSTITKWKADVETNMELADNLEGHLMLTTGTADDNVNPSNSIRMANALIKADKVFDYMILPDKAHGYGNDESYVERRRWRYFSRYLLSYKPNNVNINISPEAKDE